MTPYQLPIKHVKIGPRGGRYILRRFNMCPRNKEEVKRYARIRPRVFRHEPVFAFVYERIVVMLEKVLFAKRAKAAIEDRIQRIRIVATLYDSRVTGIHLFL